jgi:hypothetical protein
MHKLPCRVALKTCLLLACASLTSSLKAAEDPSYPPFSFANVGFTKDCNPNPTFSRLLTLITGPAIVYKDGEMPDVDGPLYDAVSGETSRRLMLDSPVDWHGLKLTGISLYSGIERGPVNYMMHFEDSPETVLAGWNKLGWKLKAVDDSREIEGLEGYASIGVSAEADGIRASVTCWRD